MIIIMWAPNTAAAAPWPRRIRVRICRSFSLSAAAYVLESRRINMLVLLSIKNAFGVSSLHPLHSTLRPTMRVERKNEITFRVYNLNFFLLSSAPILRAGFESSSSKQRRNSHENENQALGWESRSSCVWLFYFILFRFFFAAAAQHIAIDKTGQSHDFTFHRIKQTYSRKKELSRMIDENWLAPSIAASSASCVAFIPALDLLIFRVVSSRNWRMGKYVRVFTSNWSPQS